jgi:hypothetical protein
MTLGPLQPGRCPMGEPLDSTGGDRWEESGLRYGRHGRRVASVAAISSAFARPISRVSA